jgi:hypothetical protein
MAEPIFVALLGIDIPVKEVQAFELSLWQPNPPTFSTPSVIVTDVKLVHPVNVCHAISLTQSPLIVALLMDVLSSV